MEAGIYAKINAITGLVGKGYPMEAPEGTTLPYWTYERTGTERNGTLSEHGSYISMYDIRVYTNDYDSTISYRESIRDCFGYGQYTATSPYVQQVRIVNEQDLIDKETNTYTGILEIEFYYN